MKHCKLFFVACSIASFLAVAVQAADWPQFRGPFGNGIAPDTDLPVKWTKDNILWKIQPPGMSAASPIVAGDKVIIVSYSGYGLTLTKANPFVADVTKDKEGNDGGGNQQNLKRHVTCVDGKTGKVLWEQVIEPKLPEQGWLKFIREHGYASNTPITDGERIYVFFGKTGVLAFGFDGKKLWQTEVGSGTHVYGSSSSPTMHKNLVFVNATAESESLVALNKTDGKEVWRAKLAHMAKTPGTLSSPTIVHTKDGKAELVLSQAKVLIAYDPENGNELWRCQGLDVPDGGNTYCTPVSRDGVLYLQGGGGPGNAQSAFAVRAGGRGDVTKTHILWRTPKVGGTVNSPIIFGDHLYIVENFVTCLRLDDGKQVYRERLGGDSYPYASPVIAGDKLYQISRSDGLYVASLTGGKLKTLAQNAFEGDNTVFTGSPAISNGRIYVRSQQHLYCIGTK